MGDPAIFVVHSLRHLRAALAAGAEFKCPIVALSAVGASAFAGAPWFLAMVEAGRAEFPDTPLTAILDCGDRAGDALAAMKAGARHVIFTGHPEAAERLVAIAVAHGAQILDNRPDAFDLLNARDADFAARRWCKRLPNAEPIGYSSATSPKLDNPP